MSGQAFAFGLTSNDPLPNLHNVTPAIFRGGRPTAEGLQILKDNHVKAIIDLENVPSAIDAERTAAKQLGFGFMSSPMSWITPPTDDQVDKILSVMSNPNNQPIYIHCRHGRDRTGLIVAL